MNYFHIQRTHIQYVPGEQNIQIYVLLATKLLIQKYSKLQCKHVLRFPGVCTFEI